MTSSVPPINPRNQDYRIGDAERQKAMDDLGKHFAAGRLDITEYDNRLTNVAEATMMSDLIPIFSDLPAITNANTPVTIPHAAGLPDEAAFTSSEIEENYRSGKRIKLGITMLMLLPFLATMPANTFVSGIAFSVFLATVIMLYVLKLGPKSWHQPSPRTLARQRQRQIAQAEANNDKQKSPTPPWTSPTNTSNDSATDTTPHNLPVMGCECMVRQPGAHHYN